MRNIPTCEADPQALRLDSFPLPKSFNTRSFSDIFDRISISGRSHFKFNNVYDAEPKRLLLTFPAYARSSSNILKSHDIV